jgi:mRNA-degrading endonuclease RelE of RelBE toxin-antitoxin system
MNDRYEIVLTRNAEKDLDRLKHDRVRAAQELSRLVSDPYAGHSLTGSLRGARSLEFSLKGGGAYRAVYTVVDPNRICIIFVVGPHENIYRLAERRYAAVRKSLSSEQ